MKIALKVTVEMTPQQVASYCNAEAVDRGEIRDDIRQYVETALQCSAAFYDDGADVTVRAAS